MRQDEVEAVVGATLAVMIRLAERTRTQADDLMVAILRANQGRLAQAVLALARDPEQSPSPEKVAAALADVGIRV